MALTSNIRAGRAYVEVVADSTKLQRGLRNAQEQLKAFGAAASAIGRDMLTLGGLLATPFVVASKSFASFDDAMRMAQAVTQASEQEFERLTEKAQTLGRTTSYTAKQTADAMVALGRMGFKPTEIEAASDAVLSLARATGSDLSEAADIAANSLRIFRMEASDMTRASDILTAVANGSAQTLNDLFEALKVAGPQAVAAGEGFEETASALGVLANLGIKGSLAGTALRKSFSQFAKANVQKTFASVGVSAVDANGDLRPLASTIRDIAAAMRKMAGAERIAFAEEIFDLRGSLAGLSLTGNIKELDDFIARMKDIDGVASATAKKMDEGLGGSFRLLASAAEGSLNAMGQQLAVALQPLVDRITAITNATTGWIVANGSLVRGLAKAVVTVAGVGGALWGLGLAARGVGAALSIAQVAVGGVVSAFSGFASMGNGISHALGLIVTSFKEYASASAPVLVSTSRLLAALRLPMDTRANQIAASFLLMSRAETAAAARSVLASKYQAISAVLKKVRLSTLTSAVALKAHAAAEAMSTLAAKAAGAAHAFAAGMTKLFSASTAKSTVASVASTTANLALAASTKTVAAGYLTATAAARAFCAIPISAVLIGAVAAIAGLYLWLSRAGKATAKLSESMHKLREEGDANRKTDGLRLQRLKQLAEKQSLSNLEIREAERLAKTLRGRYGELGITINEMSGALTVAADAQQRLTEAMKTRAIQELEAELAECKANLVELDKEITAQQHWSHYNVWSYLSGGMDEALGTMEADFEKQQVIIARMNVLRNRIDEIESEGSEKSLTGGDEDASLEQAVSEEASKRQVAQEDAGSAQKRAAAIEQKLRRENQTELENEIKDIRSLRDEYVQLIRTMLDFERGKRVQDKDKIAELEGKLVEAEQTAERRIRAAQKRKSDEGTQSVTEAKQGYRDTLQQTERQRSETAFDRLLEKLDDTDKQAATGVLEQLVRKLDTTVEEAREAYERAVEEAAKDGLVDDAEKENIEGTRERYTRLEATRGRYEAKLERARKATEEVSAKQSPALGSFYAKAIQKLGATSVQEKTLKANQDVAKNTKQTVDLLRRQMEQAPVFK